MSIEKELNLNSESELDKSVSKALKKLTSMLDNITEYSKNDIMALSMIQTDPILKEMTNFFILNKKHIKRKHSKEILSAYKHLTGKISEQSMFQKLFKFRFGNNDMY